MRASRAGWRRYRTCTGSAGTVCSATASTVSPGSPSSRAHTTLNAPVSSAGLLLIGSPRIESQPSRSTSNGFISIATAGHSHAALWASMALEIDSRFLASELLIAARGCRGCGCSARWQLRRGWLGGVRDDRHVLVADDLRWRTRDGNLDYLKWSLELDNVVVYTSHWVQGGCRGSWPDEQVCFEAGSFLLPFELSLIDEDFSGHDLVDMLCGTTGTKRQTCCRPRT